MFAFSRSVSRRVTGSALCLLLVLGCQQESEITSYEVPKDPPAAAAVDPHANLPRTEASETRMLAAIVPREQQAWFFKLTGAPEQVDKVADEVITFVESLKLPEADGNTVTWEVPQGWSEGPPRQMREATLVLGESDPPMELAISKLGYDGDLQPYLAANINRWRGQLGLDPAAKFDESTGVKTLELDGGQAYLLDATGEMAGGGMMGTRPPFASGAPFAGDAASAPATQTPASQSPANALPTSPPKTAPTLQFDTPEGWAVLPRGSMGSRGFTLGTGDTAATLKVSDFPPVGVMGDPLANFNRWRGEVGLPPLTAETLDENTEQIEIANTEGFMSRMVSEDGKQATLAAMVSKLNRVWFFKLTGSEAAIDAHAKEFKSWLGEVRVDAVSGVEAAKGAE